MKSKDRTLTAYHGALVANKTWLTRTEVADYLGISPSMVDRNLRHSLPTYPILKNGKAYVFKREEVDEWINQNRVGADDEFFID